MNPSASGLGRAINCPASEALVHVHQDTKWSEQGTGVAAFKFRARAVGREQALLELEEDAPHRAFCEALALDQLPQGAKYELAVAWNSESCTTILLGENIGRGYRQAALDRGIDPDDTTWWFGTLDDAGMRFGRAFVGDEKTGRSCGPPAEAAQLLFGSLALTSYYGVDESEQVFYYLDDRGKVTPVGAIVNDFEHLAPFAQKLRKLPARIEAAREKVRLGVVPDVNAGSWCRHCPAQLSCPAKATAIVKVMAELPTLKERLSALEPSKAGEVYAKIVEALPILELAKNHIKEMATTVPIPLPNGEELREVEVRNKTKVVAPVAERVLKLRFGDAVAAKAIKQEPSTTKTAITNALRSVAKPGGLTALEREVFNDIRVEGGLQEGTHLEVKAVKAS